jgi:hypothetical protein
MTEEDRRAQTASASPGKMAVHRCEMLYRATTYFPVKLMGFLLPIQDKNKPFVEISRENYGNSGSFRIKYFQPEINTGCVYWYEDEIIAVWGVETDPRFYR